MRWDKVIALSMVVLGAFYAGYSGVQYFFKLNMVESVPKSDTKVVEANTAGPRQEEWLIVPRDKRPDQGERFADLIIPKLEAKMPIVEGTHEDELEKGVGHYDGSVLPGEPDNCVLSGHRDTVFRKIGQLKPGDELIVQSGYGNFAYKITKTWITTPDDRTVIVPHEKPVLTLTTCYPFTYVGPAPKRYIIQAEEMTKLE